MNFNYIKVALVLFCSVLFVACSQKKSVDNSKNPFSEIIQDKSLSQMSVKDSYSFQVLYDFEGKVDGCGCSKNPKGGLLRLKEFFKSHQDPFILAGNSFYMSYNINESDLKNKNEELKKVFDVLKGVKIPFIAPGSADLKHLPSILGLKDLLSVAPMLSLDDQQKVDLNEKAFLSKENKSIVFINYISSEKALNDEGFQDFLKKQLKSIPKDRLPVVFSREEFADIADAAKKIKRPLLFIGSNSSMVTDRPMMLGNSLFLQSLNMGQQVASIKLELNPKAESWLIVSELSFFEKRWKQLKSTKQKTQKKNSGNSVKMQEAKKFELSKIEAQLEQLRSFVPKSKRVHKIDFKLIDVDDSFAKVL